jgi:transaldolase
MSRNNPLRKLNAAGQSVWCDHIHRGMIESGGLAAMIEDDDLRGITSNPAIFDKAITGSDEYDALIQCELRRAPGQSSRELFFALAIEDIRDGADVLRPVYDATGGVDGMISLEVSPDLANDTEGTIREARELHARLDRPNVMIKVPATKAGLPAIEQLIAEGVNINVTLLFAIDRYEAVAEAYLCGLERRRAAGQSVERIASVASFFVSRVDSALDPLVKAKRPELAGKLAIANAKLAYETYKDVFSGPEWEALEAKGASKQSCLWASTSTKNPEYRDVLYVEELVGPDTVNTMPRETIEAVQDHGEIRGNTIEEDVDGARKLFDDLKAAGIDYDDVVATLEREGVEKFAKSFKDLFSDVESKRDRLVAA